MSGRGGRPPKEMTFFLPNVTGDSPVPRARELIGALRAGRAEIGTDLLTGSVEVRFYFDPELLAQARAWLIARGIPFEIDYL
ncbi:MAG: hypothetical protein SFU56_17540 [Capsulimonadales bacterium]|nr:hypothetical protein [Capsulimonadales bacterium]